MKIIEAMKRVKMNKQKISDLQNKVKSCCANLSHETPLYGEKTKSKVKEWVQSCIDLSQENVKLLVNIQRTNLKTDVTVELGEKSVTKNIAEWVWRRREYALLDKNTNLCLNDRGLQEGAIQSSTGGDNVVITITRHFDIEARDDAVSMYSDEPFLIDSKLEITNAVTDIIEA